MNDNHMDHNLILIKGAGDLATGTAHRLASCGFSIVMLEVPEPTVIRRTVSFAEAVFQRDYSVEGITARLADSSAEVAEVVASGKIAVLVDPHWSSVGLLHPAAVIDAIIAKKNLGTSLSEAPVVIGLGPGFTAGVDVHAVVETQRGHNLGKVIYNGSAAPNTGIPGEIGGYTTERLLRSPAEGVFRGVREIGDMVKTGDLVATVGESPLYAAIPGVLRGLLRSGLSVTKGFKVGDIDPRYTRDHCFTISDKARSVAGGALEALISLLKRR
jgi:xanthine dehydrogenase accessory factor